jgi:hypothetical protein
MPEDHPWIVLQGSRYEPDGGMMFGCECDVCFLPFPYAAVPCELETRFLKCFLPSLSRVLDYPYCTAGEMTIHYISRVMINQGTNFA